MTEKEPHHEFLLPLAGLGLIAISFLAFGKKSKETIWKRDKGKSVWSGRTDGLTAAHISHNKKSPKYDLPSNGRLLNSPFEQYIDHFNRHGSEGLGLNNAQNMWVLRLLFKLLGKTKLPPPDQVGKTKIKLPFK